MHKALISIKIYSCLDQPLGKKIPSRRHLKLHVIVVFYALFAFIYATIVYSWLCVYWIERLAFENRYIAICFGVYWCIVLFILRCFYFSLLLIRSLIFYGYLTKWYIYVYIITILTHTQWQWNTHTRNIYVGFWKISRKQISPRNDCPTCNGKRRVKLINAQQQTSFYSQRKNKMFSTLYARWWKRIAWHIANYTEAVTRKLK